MGELRANSELWLRLQLYNFTFSGNARAVKPYFSYKEAVEALERLPELFQDCEQQLDKTRTVENFLQKHKRSENYFIKFAADARKIRNGDFDCQELKSFRHAVQEKFSKEISLYDLQWRSAYYMAFALNSCNFSVPGAGKTRVVYGAFAYLNSLGQRNDKYVEKLLIISPLAAFKPWIKECKHCFKFALTHAELVGLNPEERRRYFQSSLEQDITLISYQSAFSSIEDIEEYLHSTEDKVMLILDEAHRIKNIQGQWARALLRLSQHARSRIILTGTPIPNSYVDLINLIDFIWPGKNIINVSAARLKYLSKNRDLPGVKEEISSFTERTKPFFIRVKKKDLGIPEPRSYNVMVDLPSNQRTIYAYIEYKCLVRILAYCPQMLSFIRE